jgi:predicted P-loop ATPase/GTPase
VTTFRQLVRKAMSKASQDREWASEVSEILKLLKIAEVLSLSWSRESYQYCEQSHNCWPHDTFCRLH